MSRPLFFLLVDAIPFDVAHEAWAEGGLPGFLEPRPMVSVFPSLTEVAVPALLRGVFEVRSPGYEARYYHPPSGEIRGPGDEAAEAALAPLRARPRGLLALAAIYVLRERLAYAQIRWITHRFRREGGPWLGYLSATDGVGHFSGREGLVRALRDVIASVREAREQYRRSEGVLPGVVMCSDHGMAFGRLRHLGSADLGARLETAGLRAGASGSERFRLVPWGEVGAGAVYVERERAVEVAEQVAAAPGVDLAFARPDETSCVVLAARDRLHRARVRWKADAYRYEPERGDPLGYGPVFEELGRAGRLDEGWARDADLFASTWPHAYPDALARIRRGLDDLVDFPAPVLFSMEDSCTYGPALTHAGALLMGGTIGSHGALTAAQSVGFAAVTGEGPDPWQGRPALRPEDVFLPWRDLVREGAAPG